MTTCTIVGIVVHCIVTTPPLPPAEAAKILAPRAYVAPADPEPFWLYPVRPSRPQDGPYGSLTHGRLEGYRPLDGPHRWEQRTYIAPRARRR